MERFRKMDTIIHADGSTEPVDVYAEREKQKGLELWRNDKYLVNKCPVTGTMVSDGVETNIIWLSIKRNDKQPIHDWRDLMEIKNELVGRYCEAVELYPSESRRVDAANQYHLFAFDNPKYRVPFGFKQRLMSGKKDAEAIGACQRDQRLSFKDWIISYAALLFVRLFKRVKK